jgi:hypothetical protein
VDTERSAKLGEFVVDSIGSIVTNNVKNAVSVNSSGLAEIMPLSQAFARAEIVSIALASSANI